MKFEQGRFLGISIAMVEWVVRMGFIQGKGRVFFIFTLAQVSFQSILGDQKYPIADFITHIPYFALSNFSDQFSAISAPLA